MLRCVQVVGACGGASPTAVAPSAAVGGEGYVDLDVGASEKISSGFVVMGRQDSFTLIPVRFGRMDNDAACGAYDFVGGGADIRGSRWRGPFF